MILDHGVRESRSQWATKGRDPRLRVPPEDGQQSTIHIVSTNSEGRHRAKQNLKDKPNVLPIPNSYPPLMESSAPNVITCS